MLLCFPSRLALPAVGQQGFFEVSPDMLHRMALVGLKAGVRIDGFARFSKALRVIREGRRDIEAKHFSLLETLSGIRTIFRGCFMGDPDAVRLILDHHAPVVRASWVVAVHVTLRRRGEGKQVPQYCLWRRPRHANVINPACARRLRHRNQEQHGKEERTMPEAAPADHCERAGQPDDAVAHRLGGRDPLNLWGEVPPRLLVVQGGTLRDDEPVRARMVER